MDFFVQCLKWKFTISEPQKKAIQHLNLSIYRHVGPNISNKFHKKQK